jgi:hypothetical protein
MSTSKLLYPDYGVDSDTFYGPCDYQPIINSFGKVLIQVDDKDYQGDSRVILEHEGKIGWLNFGWGSCSGCDALQACNTHAEVDQLIVELRNSIKWFDSIEELKHFFKTKCWDLDYSWHSEEQNKFIEQVLNYIPQ